MFLVVVTAVTEAVDVVVVMIGAMMFMWTGTIDGGGSGIVTGVGIGIGSGSGNGWQGEVFGISVGVDTRPSVPRHIHVYVTPTHANSPTTIHITPSTNISPDLPTATVTVGLTVTPNPTAWAITLNGIDPDAKLQTASK